MSEIPTHIAIVMDGNGRWAKERKLPRVLGHKAGVQAANDIIKSCSKSNINVLTLFAFSSENWRRPTNEVNALMKLFFDALHKYTKDLNKYNIRLRVIGDLTKLAPKLQKRISESEQATANNTGMCLNAAINYSGRWDIVQATQKIAEKVVQGQIDANEINEQVLQAELMLADLPEPDLFIRTSGEVRISNFMIWQFAYTELYFTEVLWPDFTEEDLAKAIFAYRQRERRFGGIGGQ